MANCGWVRVVPSGPDQNYSSAGPSSGRLRNLYGAPPPAYHTLPYPLPAPQCKSQAENAPTLPLCIPPKHAVAGTALRTNQRSGTHSCFGCFGRVVLHPGSTLTQQLVNMGSPRKSMPTALLGKTYPSMAALGTLFHASVSQSIFPEGLCGNTVVHADLNCASLPAHALALSARSPPKQQSFMRCP